MAKESRPLVFTCMWRWGEAGIEKDRIGSPKVSKSKRCFMDLLKGRKVPICDWKWAHLSTPRMISLVATLLTTGSCHPCTHLLTTLGVWFCARHNYNVSGNVQTNSISPPSEIRLLLLFTCYWKVPYKSNGYLISVHLRTNLRHYPLLNENTMVSAMCYHLDFIWTTSARL